MFEQIGNRAVRVLDQRDGRFNDFAQVMGRNIGRHADRDPGGAVDQEIRESCGQHDRLFSLAVVVGAHLDGVFA